eukprot:10940627-Alexandrium_andersonii.AAC.1
MGCSPPLPPGVLGLLLSLGWFSLLEADPGGRRVLGPALPGLPPPASTLGHGHRQGAARGASGAWPCLGPSHRGQLPHRP